MHHLGARDGLQTFLKLLKYILSTLHSFCLMLCTPLLTHIKVILNHNTSLLLFLSAPYLIYQALWPNFTELLRCLTPPEITVSVAPKAMSALQS